MTATHANRSTGVTLPTEQELHTNPFKISTAVPRLTELLPFQQSLTPLNGKSPTSKRKTFVFLL